MRNILLSNIEFYGYNDTPDSIGDSQLTFL